MEETIKKYISNLKPNERLRDKPYVEIAKKIEKNLFRSDISDIAKEYFTILEVSKEEAEEIRNYLRLKLEVFFMGVSIASHKSSYDLPAYGLFKSINLKTQAYNILFDTAKKYKLSRNEVQHAERKVINSIDWQVTKGLLSTYND